MKAEDHIVAYVESDATYYARLCDIARRRKPNCKDGFMRPQGIAAACSNLASDAYSDMLRNGSASRDDMYNAAELLKASLQFAEWEQPE